LDDEGRITNRQIFGYLIATSPESDLQPPAGLVLALQGLRSVETGESSLGAAQLIAADVGEKWDLLPPEAHRFWAIQRQYWLKFAGQDITYTFVKWASDEDCYEACCQLRYSVFAGEQTPLLVATYSGQCDI
jgi:hypothetical protein